MGFIFSLEDKSNEWSTEDKLNVLSTAVSYASPSQGFHSLFGSFVEESFDGFHFLFRRQIERVEHRRQFELLCICIITAVSYA